MKKDGMSWLKVVSGLTAVLTTFLLPIATHGAVIRVPADQPTIQAGIDAAIDGDVVLVADGTYTGDGNRDIDFLGKAITVRSENGAENCIIGSYWGTGRRFYFHNGEGEDSVLAGFTIRTGSGDGIDCRNASPKINNNIVTAQSHGVICVGGSPTIINTAIIGNSGGIYCDGGSITIINSSITGNDGNEPGIYIYVGDLTIINSTIAENDGYAGIYSEVGDLTIIKSTITENDGIGIFSIYGDLTVTNTIFWGNGEGEIIVIDSPDPTVTYSNVQGGWPGEGNIDADPLFVTGPHGDYSLSQIVCGDPEDSPCVDAGDPATEVYGTTNCIFDTGVVDMGYHYPAMGLVVGPGPALANPPDVRVFIPEQDAVHTFEIPAYGAPHYGVNVCIGSVDDYGCDNIITGAGPGDIYGPHVRGFAVDGTSLPGLSFLAYGTNKYGVNVATGDIDADGFDEIITGAGPGTVFGPHVRAFDYDGTPGVNPVPGVSFFAYGTPKWGVKVSSGDIDGDGYDEIVTGAGPGAVYGPHVRGWNVDGGPTQSIPAVSFLAYGTHKYGVNVTCGDVDGDGIDEIVTAPGPGRVFSTHVRGWNYDGSSLSDIPGINFLAWPYADSRYGANVFAGADLDDDGRDELVVGLGPDPNVRTTIKVYKYDDSQVTEWFSLEAFSDLGYTHGTNVSAGRF